MKVGNLSSQVPTDHARYHLFLFKHTHEGDYTESIGKIINGMTVIFWLMEVYPKKMDGTLHHDVKCTVHF